MSNANKFSVVLSLSKTVQYFLYKKLLSSSGMQGKENSVSVVCVCVRACVCCDLRIDSVLLPRYDSSESWTLVD
jgi:hypothetical protein